MKVWSVALPSMCQALFDVLEPKKKKKKSVRDTDIFETVVSWLYILIMFFLLN